MLFRSELVPVREERSIDQDLLEDASARIESLLKEQGYRTARAPYSRDSKGNEHVVTFTVTRGPLHRIDAITTAGNERLSDADLAPLLQIKPGDPFVDARVGLVSAAIGESYRVRGFSQAAVRANVQVLPESSANGVTFRPVSIRFDITEGPQTVVTTVEFEGVKAIAVEMPAGASTTILDAAKESPLTNDEFMSLVKGLHQGQSEMQAAGIIHHDIKPANVTFDRDKGQVMYVDLGSAEQLSPGGKTDRLNSNSSLYLRPDIQNGVEHGVEVDRYAIAMTILSSLSPSLEAVAGGDTIARSIFEKGSRAPEAQGTPWADAISRSLAEAKGSATNQAVRQQIEKAEAELQASFQQIGRAHV